MGQRTAVLLPVDHGDQRGGHDAVDALAAQVISVGEGIELRRRDELAGRLDHIAIGHFQAARCAHQHQPVGGDDLAAAHDLAGAQSQIGAGVAAVRFGDDDALDRQAAGVVIDGDL
jgi:hypothetical protein